MWLTEDNTLKLALLHFSELGHQALFSQTAFSTFQFLHQFKSFQTGFVSISFVLPLITL